jgi:transposase
MAQWLKAGGIQTVVMRATGVYWIALFQILESYGFQAHVVNARHTKTLPGRKTDLVGMPMVAEAAHVRVIE